MSISNLQLCYLYKNNPRAVAGATGLGVIITGVGRAGDPIAVPGRLAGGSVQGGMRRFGHRSLWCLFIVVLMVAMAGTVNGAVFSDANACGGFDEDPQGAMARYCDAEAWLHAWETPDSSPLPKGVVGVWVAIRQSGQILGDAHEIRRSDDDPTLLRALPRSLRRAMAQTEAVASKRGNDPVEAIDQAKAIRNAALTLEVQFAHLPQRVRGRGIEKITPYFEPGIHGIIIEAGAKKASVFPGQMLADQRRPLAWITSLLSELKLTVGAFEQGLASGEVKLWRFTTDHLTQVQRGAPPNFMHRGGRVVSAGSIQSRELRTFADEMAEHLIAIRWPFSQAAPYEGLMGAYHPDFARYAPLQASIEEQGVTALALLRYAQPGKGRKAASVNAAQKLAMEILDALANGGNMRWVEAEEKATAMVLLALRELEPDQKSDAMKLLEARGRTALARTFDPANGFADRFGVSEQAAMAYALGTREAVDAVWRDTPMALQPSVLPWLGWAEMDLAKGKEAIRSRRGLRTLRDQLWSKQVGGLDEAGGLDLAKRIGGPDWHSIRPLAFLATMAGEGRLTDPNERMGEVLRVISGMRFLRQLSVREEDRYRLPDAPRSLGAIQVGLDRHSLPPAATAMGLLAVVETLDMLDLLASEENR